MKYDRHGSKMLKEIKDVSDATVQLVKEVVDVVKNPTMEEMKDVGDATVQLVKEVADIAPLVVETFKNYRECPEPVDKPIDKPIDKPVVIKESSVIIEQKNTVSEVESVCEEINSIDLEDEIYGNEEGLLKVIPTADKSIKHIVSATLILKNKNLSIQHEIVEKNDKEFYIYFRNNSPENLKVKVVYHVVF